MRPSRLQRSLVPVAGLVAAATVAAGLTIRPGGRDLGTPQPPFVSVWSPRVPHPLVLVALACCVAAVALVPRLLRLPPRAFAAATLLLTLVLRLAVNAARIGPGGWVQVFGHGREAGNEYLPALPAFRYGPHWFLDNFAELVPALPVHAAGHPPGLLLTMHYAGLTTPARLAAFCIAAGALAAPL